MPDYKKLIRRKKTNQTKASPPPKEPKRLLNKIALLVVFCLLLSIAALGIRSLLKGFGGFKIKQVSVVTQEGKSVSNPRDFFYLDLHELNLFDIDLQRISADIQARHPELDKVVIYKKFPNRLLITVKEKQPVAIVMLKDSYLTDAQGFILPYRSVYHELPKIIGVNAGRIELYQQSSCPGLKKALELLGELKKANLHPEYPISHIDVKKYSDLIFYLDGKTEIRMGEANLARKIKLLSKILGQLKESNTVPRYIDMRFDSPVVGP